ncbi:MAG: pilus assembly PilX family protein [Casimicrobium sp.]
MSKLNQRRGRGFALVVALLLLVALSLIGVAGLRNVTLQEKMAGNSYFRNIAFNEAQASLHLGQQKTFDLFGTTAATFAPCSATSGTNRCTLSSGGSAAYFANDDTAWIGAVTVLSPLNIGFNSDWVNERINPDASIDDPSCQLSQGVSSDPPGIPCGRSFMRTTSRSRDVATGATSITQQYFRFLGGPNENK